MLTYCICNIAKMSPRLNLFKSKLNTFLCNINKLLVFR